MTLRELLDDRTIRDDTGALDDKNHLIYWCTVANSPNGFITDEELDTTECVIPSGNITSAEYATIASRRYQKYIERA